MKNRSISRSDYASVHPFRPHFKEEYCWIDFLRWSFLATLTTSLTFKFHYDFRPTPILKKLLSI